MPILQNHATRVTGGVPANNQDVQVVHKYITHVAKFKPQSVVIYKQYHGFRHEHTQAELDNLEKGKNGEYNGYLSPATIRQIRGMLENWLLCLEYNVTRGWSMTMKEAMADRKLRHRYCPTFVTLTLPSKQVHDDNYIKREMLNRFIIKLQQRYGVLHYFWRAEPQKNGNIHFHILVDKWIHWRRIRDEWNRICNDHGYIDGYRLRQQARHANGFQPDLNRVAQQVEYIRTGCQIAGTKFDPRAARAQAIAQQKRAYDEGVQNNWSSPNSTDIHAIEKVESLTAYVVKYVCKASDIGEVEVKDSSGEVEMKLKERKIMGRIWGCSDSLRTLKHFEAEIAFEADFHCDVHDDTDEFRYIAQVEKLAEKETEKDLLWHDEESGTKVIQLTQKQQVMLRTLYPGLYERYKNHYDWMYNFLYNQRKVCEMLEHLFAGLLEIVTIVSGKPIDSDEQRPTRYGFAGVQLAVPF